MSWEDVMAIILRLLSFIGALTVTGASLVMLYLAFA